MFGKLLMVILSYLITPIKNERKVQVENTQGSSIYIKPKYIIYLCSIDNNI
jgi:hypothetical protein